VKARDQKQLVVAAFDLTIPGAGAGRLAVGVRVRCRPLLGSLSIPCSRNVTPTTRRSTSSPALGRRIVRGNITPRLASPLRASGEQFPGLPPALVIVDEADVLRDESEACAAHLRAAGVAVTTVRYDGITHDFMMLNPLSGTHATRAAVAQAIAVLREALHRA
jgi:acetyl esterase/lipase